MKTLRLILVLAYTAFLIFILQKYDSPYPILLAVMFAVSFIVLDVVSGRIHHAERVMARKETYVVRSVFTCRRARGNRDDTVYLTIEDEWGGLKSCYLSMRDTHEGFADRIQAGDKVSWCVTEGLLGTRFFGRGELFYMSRVRGSGGSLVF